MKKRGFTLVELLAIIIIIGIIAVITTTAILGIVNDADEAAFEKSIVGLIDSVEYYLWENDIDELPNKCVSIDELGVKNSEQFENGKVCQDDNGNLYVSQLKSTTQELCASGTKDSVRISDDCEKLDDTPPELVDSGIIVSRTTNSITVRVTTNGIIENESSIKSYKYELTGVTDSSISKSSNEIDDTTYSFTGLKSGTYTVKLTVTNGNNLESSIERKIILLDCPTPTITATPTGWQTKKTITINYGENNTCEASYSYSTDGGSTFSEWKNGTGFETSTNGTMIRAKNTDGINTVTSSTFTVSQIDTTGPSASLAINNVTTSKATVTATCTDGQSGITKYEFYNGSTLVEIYNTSATTQSHTYTGLGKESTNNLKVVCINGSGLTRDSSDSATTTTVTPSYAIDKEGWQTSKTVTITYPTVNGETFTNQYKIGTGEWQTVSGNTQSVPFTENGNVTARMLDENNNEFAASTYNVSEIDISSPTCNIEVTGTTGSNSWYTSSTVSINAVGATTGSSNLTVVLKKDGTVVASPYTLSDNTAGTTFSATVTNEAGTSATCDSVTIKKDSSTPGAPTITASDSITSGSWHTSGNAFTLTVAGSSSTSTIDYYLLDASNPPTTERDSVSVSSDTSGTTYYAKACNKAGTCGNNATYVVRRDTCNATVTISGNSTSSSSYSKNNITLTANPGTCTSSVTSYQWYKNNSAISGATSRTYTASDIGSNTYSVRVDYGSGKYATNSTIVYIDKSTPTCNIEVTGTTGSNSWYTSSTVSIKAVGTATGSTSVTTVLKKAGTTVASPYTLSDNTTGTTFSATVTNSAGTSATCTNVTIKKDSNTPGAPTIAASDGIASGSWHTSGNAFTLTASGSSSTSGIDHYLLDASSTPTTSRSSVSVSSDTSGTTYYAKACNGAGTCSSSTGTYVVRRDTCNATVTISGNNTSSSNYSSSSVTLTANPGTCTSSVTSYQWYKNNSAISGATSRTYTASDIGSNTYSVRVDYGSGKYATSTTTVYIAVTASDLTYDDTNTGLGCTGSSAHVQCALEKIYNMVK